MKIQYCSDLHLEFQENKKYLKSNTLPVSGDILILAGDIIPFAVMHKHADFFSWASDNFKYTYWIPGNHEYYYSDAFNKSGFINESIRNNVFLVNNYVVNQENFKLVFATLWSKISSINHWAVQQNIADFQVIQFNGQKFNPEHFNALHKDALQFISSALEEESNAKTVVVTHHVPTLLQYPEQFKGSELNEVFAVELYEQIQAWQPDYWIYGHHHQNVPDFNIGNTKLTTNQLGYIKYKEHINFEGSKLINI